VPTPCIAPLLGAVHETAQKSCNYLLQDNISQHREILSNPAKLLISFSGVVRDQEAGGSNPLAPTISIVSDQAAELAKRQSSGSRPNSEERYALSRMISIGPVSLFVASAPEMYSRSPRIASSIGSSKYSTPPTSKRIPFYLGPSRSRSRESIIARPAAARKAVEPVRWTDVLGFYHALSLPITSGSVFDCRSDCGIWSVEGRISGKIFIDTFKLLV